MELIAKIAVYLKRNSIKIFLISKIKTGVIFN